MTTRKSERQRWAKVFHLPQPSFTAKGIDDAKARHDELLVLLEAFFKTGRVVRAKPAKFGNGIEFTARRS